MDTQIIVALIGVGGVILTIAGTLGGAYLGTVLNRLFCYAIGNGTRL